MNRTKECGSSVPFQTTARGGLQRHVDESRVIGPWADDGMLVQDGQRGLLIDLAADELAKRPNAEHRSPKGCF